MRSPTDAIGAPAIGPASAGPSPLDRLVGRGYEVRTASVVLLMGIAALAIGLSQVSGSADWGFTLEGAASGLLSQLPATGPAAVLIAAATAANILAGAIVLRILGTPAFRSLSDLILGGFAAAVVLDAATLFALGSLGLFGWPELLLLHLGALAAYLARRASLPLLATRPRLRLRRPAAWWPVVVAVWAGPFIAQLASPAAPFLDVLPNHVAPVEHARVFGSFATLTTSPSPIYGPSRLMLGYVGLLGDLTTIANLEAILAVAAFALPLSILMAIALRQTTSRLFGGSSGFWVLLTFPLTFTFMRLGDTRGTVAAFPLAIYALGAIAQELRAGKSASDLGDAPPVSRADLPLAAALGGAILLHPLVGLVAAAAATGMLALDPARLGPRLMPALGTAALIALPQAVTMLGIAAPAWSGFVCLVAAVSLAPVLAWLFAPGRLVTAFSVPRQFQVIAIVAVIGFCLVLAREHIPTPDDPMSELYGWFPRLLIVTFVGAALGVGRPSHGWVVLGSGIAAGLAAWAASGLVGFNSLTQQAIHYEVPKTIEYWLPVMLSIGAAAGISAFWRLRRLDVLRPLALAVFVLAAILPIPGPLTSNVQIGEHRGAESLGLALREAQQGYWVGYPDTRRIVDESEQQVVDELRAEVNAGRLGPSTRVLHLASSFQQWSSVPIGVFMGALETSISLQPELSIHTDGGRLLGFDRLADELASGYGYVVLEPDGLDSSLADTIAAAGYRQIWANSRATIYTHS